MYCGERFETELLTVDHVQPKMRGGDRSGGNLVTACGGCNARKGALRLSRFLHDDPVARRHFFTLAAPHVWPRILRTDPVARERFFALAAPHVWPRILRTVELELARPPRTR